MTSSNKTKIFIDGQHGTTGGQPDPRVGHVVRQQPRLGPEWSDLDRAGAGELAQGV